MYIYIYIKKVVVYNIHTYSGTSKATKAVACLHTCIQDCTTIFWSIFICTFFGQKMFGFLHCSTNVFQRPSWRCAAFGGCVASTSELPALVEVLGATVAGFLGGVLPTPRKRLGVNSWDSECERRYCGCVQCTSRSSVFLLLQSV